MPRKNKVYKLKIKDFSLEDYNQMIEIPILMSFTKRDFYFSLVKKGLIKIIAVLLIIALNWTGLSAVYQTWAFFKDTENSLENFFQAGILDFELTSENDFLPSPIALGESATRTISILNFGNEHQYKITATNFSSPVCDYLQLEANLNQGEIEYFGLLKDFVDFGPTIFQEPANWHFTLTLPSTTSEEFLGQSCEFDFVFFGSQTKNDLPFGTGFRDEETIHNRIVTAICENFEIRSMGYWKNHENVYITYLPQYLGGYPEDEIIDSVEKADEIFNANNSIMRNKLKKQLLAMKFNIAHFGIGGYLVESEGKTLNEIVAEADNLLRNASSTNEELEAMKDLLDGLNNLETIRYCHSQLPKIEVLVPNGGEVWWVGRSYDITWSTENLNCTNDIYEVSIWYSRDSGNTWANIVTGFQNNGVYNWRVPLSINGYLTPSSNARIKIVARCSDNQMIFDWDISDNDFCPPIDFDLLLPEEIELLKQMGLIETFNEETTDNEEVIVEQEELEISEEKPEMQITEEEQLIQEDLTTTEEILNEQIEENEFLQEINEEKKEESSETIIIEQAARIKEELVETNNDSNFEAENNNKSENSDNTETNLE